MALNLPIIAADKEKEADDSWIQEYYQHPHPDRFEAEVKKLQASGALKNKEAIPPMAAFFSRLFQSAKSEQLSQWLEFTGSLPDEDQQVFLIALRWANTDETQKALQKIASQKSTFASKLLDSKPPALDKITNPAPEELDMCWGAFFATGDPAYALPVIRTAVKPTTKNVVDMSQQSARWSLKALCRTHSKLREIKDNFYKTASSEEQKSLDELFTK